MSVQAGIWQRDGGPVDGDLLTRMSATATQYGPDGEAIHRSRSLLMLYRPFCTNAESRTEAQPFVSYLGNVATWDGRLDNRNELISDLRDSLGADRTDVALAVAAWERWHDDAFVKLKGDWALSLWSPKTQSLRLARDFMGVRSLYYNATPQRIVWCTDLSALVLNAGVQFTINEEFIAGYLAYHPDAHLTPYAEIAAVPPGSFVVVRPQKIEIKRYWRFKPGNRIVYKTDAEYEEHFRLLFRQAVKRRLRSDSPVLAELSGGLDSSSIVCMAHDIISKGEATATLETISHYGDADSDGDERPFFTKVEEWIGKRGHHVSLDSYFRVVPPDGVHFLPRPGVCSQDWLTRDMERVALLHRLGGRVVLSGVGGDELLGGVPDPVTPLADRLCHLQLGSFWKELQEWSLKKHLPLTDLIWQVLTEFQPPRVKKRWRRIAKLEPWINPEFAGRHKMSERTLGCPMGWLSWLPKVPSQTRIYRTLASFISDLNLPSITGCFEKGYPYLDRDLMAFLVSIPSEQLLRPTQRRSLMRRALVKLVPHEVLFRKTKWLAKRQPYLTLIEAWPVVLSLTENSDSAARGFINSNLLRASLSEAMHGREMFQFRIFKVLSLEMWLRDLADRRLVKPGGIEVRSSCSVSADDLRASSVSLQ